ncbi:MAG: CRISPR-associated endonuclease Cas2 [Candidatus Izemoplasma sp.]|nr:CRISPR-associated endonuclease Cas2 [Candidatus Izemoplasma sp.]
MLSVYMLIILYLFWKLEILLTRLSIQLLNMNTYEFMRTLVFYDLPIKTNKDKKIYRRFRRILIKNGYTMIQYSVYSKILNNRDAAKNHIKFIKKNAPNKGNIRVMMITEKQYANIKVIVGGKSFIENKLTIEPFVLF